MIILKKGIVDIISDGKSSYYVKSPGSLKRCGGQGDILSGILGSFVNYQDNLEKISSDPEERAVLSVVASCILNRKVSHSAFLRRKISLTTPDIIEELPNVLN